MEKNEVFAFEEFQQYHDDMLLKSMEAPKVPRLIYTGTEPISEEVVAAAESLGFAVVMAGSNQDKSMSL